MSPVSLVFHLIVFVEMDGVDLNGDLQGVTSREGISVPLGTG